MHDDDELFARYTPHPTFERPTLLSSCSRAATTAEQRFRVPYPNSIDRQSRVIALDLPAAAIMADIAGEAWRAARFYRLGPRRDANLKDVDLVALDGTAKRYSAELEDADVIILIATTSDGAREATTIGRLARESATMTAAIIVSGMTTDNVVAALRPAAAVLVIANESDYLLAMLSALRA